MNGRRRTSAEAGPKEEHILVDHEEDGIRRSRNKPLALSVNWRKRNLD
jgi:hypothetical protein